MCHATIKAINLFPQIKTLPNLKRPIVVRLQDGLGNQLFQYSLGRTLANINQCSVVFDTSWYESPLRPNQPRELGLLDFRLNPQFSTATGFSSYWIQRGIRERVRWWIQQRWLPINYRRFVQQNPQRFLVDRRMYDPRVLKVKPGTYLAGWWISPYYFESISAELKEEIVLKCGFSGLASGYAAKMQDTNSVAVHIRLGDYAKHPEIGILGLQYYEKAISIIKQTIKDPDFYIFSDEPQVARARLNALIPNAEVIRLEPGARPSIDLMLMAQCKHFINANSTFSWWAAWLSRNSHAMVVVPDKWYAGSGIAIPDIYPNSWIKVSI